MTLEVPKVSLDPATIADMLEAQTDAGLSDVRHKRTEHVFECERRWKEGGPQRVKVRLVEEGGKYCFEVNAEDGAFAQSNTGESIADALTFVHWWELDESHD